MRRWPAVSTPRVTALQKVSRVGRAAGLGEGDGEGIATGVAGVAAGVGDAIRAGADVAGGLTVVEMPVAGAVAEALSVPPHPLTLIARLTVIASPGHG